MGERREGECAVSVRWEVDGSDDGLRLDGAVDVREGTVTVCVFDLHLCDQFGGVDHLNDKIVVSCEDRVSRVDDLVDHRRVDEAVGIERGSGEGCTVLLGLPIELRGDVVDVGHKWKLAVGCRVWGVRAYWPPE